MKRMGGARCALRMLMALSGLTLVTAADALAEPSEHAFHDPSSCARPALWVVNDADTTIFLFGTVHTHDGTTQWFDHAVRRAFDASSILVLETLIPAEKPQLTVAKGSGLAAAREAV